jgi:hypothetical protein
MNQEAPLNCNDSGVAVRITRLALSTNLPQVSFSVSSESCLTFTKQREKILENSITVQSNSYNPFNTSFAWLSTRRPGATHTIHKYRFTKTLVNVPPMA